MIGLPALRMTALVPTPLSLAVGLLSILTLGILAAEAQSYEQVRNWCFGNATNEQVITGCDAVIADGRGNTRDLAVAHNSRGRAYRNKGDYGRAIADYDEAIRLKPDYAFAFHNRCIAYGEKAETDRAIGDCDQAIRLKPDYVEAFFDRGLFYKDKRAYDRAIADYTEAIRLKPNYAEAFNNRGNAYKDKGDFDRAIADYDEAIRLKPDYAFAFNDRGIVLDNKREYDRAISDFDQAIRLKPDYAEAFNNRGIALDDKHEYDRAISDFDQAIRLWPNYAFAFNNRGIVYKNKGDYGHAIADYDQAIRLKPDYKVAINNRVLAITERDRQAATQQAKPAPAAPLDGTKERRVALVIGNSAYRATGQLPNPARDAELVGNALRRSGVEDVTVLHDLDRAGMISALNSFSEKADKADWAILYYAGHGMEMDGTNYLIPVDAQLRSDRSLPDETITLQRMLASLENARKLRLVVLDACRNNPFATQMKLAGARRAMSRGLARVEPSNATLVIYAAKEGTTAQDGDGEDSPFATAFANRLAQPGVEINKVFRFVRQDVLNATGNQQEPFTYGSLPPEDFYFVGAK